MKFNLPIFFSFMNHPFGAVSMIPRFGGCYVMVFSILKVAVRNNHLLLDCKNPRE